MVEAADSDSRSILLVDDDQDGLLSLIRALRAAGLAATFHGAGNVNKALSIFKESKPHVAVIDLSIDEKIGVESGFSLLQELLKVDPSCRIIVLTGHGTIEYGVKCLSLGAANFLQKPADIPHLVALLKDGFSQSEIRREHARLKNEVHTKMSSFIIGVSDKMKQVLASIQYAGASNQAVLISGETGTGKGLCALAIHKFSNRNKFNFVRYQPNFSTPDLVNSDLFGHVKGAFTGANEERRGLLFEANQGTLFLDEIDELPLETQVSLLGVLQDKKFRQLGSNKEGSVDFRLVCASNQDLKKCVENGKIRKDFYHRIAHFLISVPALREHKEDLEPLALALLEKVRERGDLSVLDITKEAKQKLHSYDWPGNIRELEAQIEGAAYRAQYHGRAHIEVSDINLGLSSRSEGQVEGSTFHERVDAFKMKVIREALDRNGGNQVKAAAELGLDRSTLRRIIGKVG